MDTARRNVAERLADILADAEIVMVIAQTLLSEAFGLPELRVAGSRSMKMRLQNRGLSSSA